MQPNTHGLLLRPVHATHTACLAYDTKNIECAAFVFKSDTTAFKIIHGLDPETIENGVLYNNATPSLLVTNTETVVRGHLKATTFGYDASFNMCPQSGNEINFGGSSTATDIYFGYRSYDERPTPTVYNFSRGSGAIKVGTIYQFNQLVRASAVQSSTPSTTNVLWAY